MAASSTLHSSTAAQRRQLPGIGSTTWWKRARRQGVVRPSVELSIDRALEETAGGAELSAHRFCRPSVGDLPLTALANQASYAASLFLLHRHAPSYGTLMYVIHVFHPAKRPLRVWITEQFATVLRDGSEAQRASAMYALEVDYFSVPTRNAFVRPRLQRLLPDVAFYEGA